MEPERKPVVSKEELPSKKRVIKIEEGETSHGCDKLVTSIDQLAQTQSGLSREERVKMFEEIKDPTSTTPKIQKVIFLLRDHKDFVKYYEPRVVSLGPIHHGKEKYRLAETFKLRLAKLFVDDIGANSRKTTEELLKAVDGNIKELRECFEKEVTNKYKDGDLAWILFVDGCAILQYICVAVEDKYKELNIKPDSVAFCQQDLFLLENQVPYHLLELLMRSSGKIMEKKLKKSIDDFIKTNHSSVLMGTKQPEGEICQSGNGKRKPTHLLDILRSSLLGSEGNQPTTQGYRKKSLARQSYRNVEELKAAGIHVKPSKDNSLRGIYFQTNCCNFYPRFPSLLLPPLIVDDSTAPKFLNLIAYEMCLDFENDFGITSYVAFLDSLIDEANDVKKLRKAHVLFNLLGSDEEVAKLFNDIGTDLVPDFSEYENVRSQIQKYYDKTWARWMAELYNNHFSSPWSIAAFVGALLALALTAIQAWYAVDSPPSPCDNFCNKFNQKL